MRVRLHYRNRLALYAITLLLWQALAHAFDTIPSSGPHAGGNIVAVTNVFPNIGNGSDITNLTVSGVDAQIVAQGVAWVTFIAPAASTSGTTELVIQSASLGSTTLINAYTYNPQGQIGVVTEDWTRWQEVAGLLEPRRCLAAADLQGALYSIGGAGAPSKTNVSIWTGDSWCDVSGLPSGRQSHQVGKVGGLIYCVGGNDGRYAQTNVFRYDGTNWSEVLGLPTPRSGHAVGVLHGNLYSMGGWGGGSATDVFRFDGTSWTVAPSLPEGRFFLSAISLGGFLYAISGIDATSEVFTSRKVFRFDGTNWTRVVDIPRSCESFAVAANGGSAYVIGGRNGEYGSTFAARTNVFRYDGSNWVEIAGLPVPRAELAAGVAGGVIYAIGGTSVRTLSDPGTSNVFRYPALIQSSGVFPESGSRSGGYHVTITGHDIGSGNDITNVTLCGVSVASIVSQSGTQVVVVAGASESSLLGHAVVYSTAFGMALKSNAFRYGTPIIDLSGDLSFGKVRMGASATRYMMVTNDGDVALAVTNIIYPSCFTGPTACSVASGSATMVPVVFSPTNVSAFGGFVSIESDSFGGVNALACTGIGASSVPTTWYVRPDGSDLAPATNWDTAKQTIQAAIDEALMGDTVLVSNGLYAIGSRAISNGSPNRIAVDKAITVKGVNGPLVTTILGQGPVGPSAVRCAYLADGAALQGFTLTGGATWNTGNTFSAQSGGAVNCTSTGGVIRECIIVSNTAYYGGGAHREGSLYDCQLLNNSTLNADGGASYYGTLVRCRVEHNQAGRNGLGGGLYRSSAYSCLIAHNTNSSLGGGTFASSLFNCTVFGNATTGSVTTGGGVSGGTSINCIVVGNYSAAGDHNFNTNNIFGGLATLESSCTFPVPPLGSGNITNDPQFVDLLAFRVASGSPCTDKGTNQDWMLGAGDLDGKQRVVNSTVDIGAYEYPWDGYGDADNDAIPDYWESGRGLNPAISNSPSSNSDSDWMSDYDEYIADTQPTNSASRFPDATIAIQTPGLVMLMIDPTSTARIYGVFGKTNLLSDPQIWLLSIPERTGTGSAMTFVVTNGTEKQMYRTGVRLP